MSVCLIDLLIRSPSIPAVAALTWLVFDWLITLEEEVCCYIDFLSPPPPPNMYLEGATDLEVSGRIWIALGAILKDDDSDQRTRFRSSYICSLAISVLRRKCEPKIGALANLESHVIRCL